MTGCVIDILSAKNDPEHKGHRMFFSKADLVDKRQTYCITTALWMYAQSAHPTRGRPFFYIANLNWTLKPPYFNACLREMAIIHFSLNPKRVFSHSLRIEGASTLAAAGVPDYIILDMGRWKSLAFLAYVRRTTKMFEIARYALSRNNLITLDKIQLMHPSCSTV